MDIRAFPLRRVITITVFMAAGALTAHMFRSETGAAHTGRERATVGRMRPPGKPAMVNAEAELAAFLRADTPLRQMTAALHLGENATPAEIRALLNLAHRFPAAGARGIAVAALLRRWLALAPAAALEYSRNRQVGFLPKLIASFAVTRPEEAKAFLLTLPKSDTRKESWRELAFSVSPGSPEKAWDLLLQARQSENWLPEEELFFQPVVRKLAAEDVDNTLARLEGPPGFFDSMTRQAVCDALMKADPARGWKWISSQENHNELREIALGTILKNSPDAALRQLAELSAKDQLETIEVHSLWRLKDLSPVISALEADTSLPPETIQALALRLFRESADRDPAAAVQLLTLGEPALRPRDFSGLFWEWAGRDPAAGESWVASLPEGKIRDTATEAWRERMDSRARDQEEEAADAAKPGHRSLLSVWDTGEPVLDVWEKLGRMTPEQLNAEISANARITKDRALASLAFVNPAAGAAWLQTWTITEKSGPDAAKFAAEWGRADPAAAAAWVSTLPAGALANTAANNVARQYRRYAPAEAEAWVKTLPAGLIQDSARKGMAE